MIMFTCNFIGVRDKDNDHVSNELKMKLQEMSRAIRLSDTSDEAFACGQLSKESYTERIMNVKMKWLKLHIFLVTLKNRM